MSSRSAALARKSHKLSTEQVVESPALDAAAGLVYLSLALFYLLALISHDPADLPAWTHLAVSDTPTAMAHNLIGRLGAVMAGYSFWMLGAANYLIPICLTWFGVCKFSSWSRVSLRSWLGFAMMVASGAAILYLQAIWPWDDKNVTPYGAGGGLGFVVGGRLMVGIFGEVGSLLMLGASYLIGLVFMTGMHPIQVVLHGKNALIRGTVSWWDERKRRKMEAEDLATLPFTVPPPEPRAKKQRKAEDINIPDQLELPPVQPLPKIVDSSVPKPPAPKPQLAEVWKSRAAQKQERVAFAQPTSLTARFKDYRMPSMDLLHYPDVKGRTPADESALREMQNSIIRTLATFDIRVTAGDITKGPAITRYEVYPVDGLRVSRIANLEADLARATRAERINILAPIPGKDTVGIELPNRDRIVVPIRELLEDEDFQKGKHKLPLALGKDVYGKAIIADLATMPHLLVAGATGSGKSVCINSIITSLLCRYAPDELRFIMIDPKVVEMQGYKDLPHLALPVVTDPKLALLALRWVVNEMEKRYQIFAKEGCRNFDTFNSRHSKVGGHKVSTSRVGAGTVAEKAPAKLVEEEIAPPPAAESKFKSPGKGKGAKIPHPDSIEDGDVLDELDAEDGYAAPTGPLGWFGSSEPPPRKEPELEIPDSLPYIVVIVDELADLMQTAPADIEVAIARIAQKARAAGIHLILATQTPRADVVTGIIKANVPCRIAFQVSSALDSRVILDRKGADRLVGKGDMLYLPPGTSQLIRAQGTMVTDDELHSLVDHACNQGKPLFEATLAAIEETGEEEDGGEITAEDEATLEKILEILRVEKKASTSHIQRRLRLGYNRAARMMDILEARGIIGPADGAKPREILVEL